MITLPDPPSRSDLIGFAGAGGVALVIASLVATWLAGSIGWAAGGAAGAVGLAVLGRREPERLGTVYRFWNRTARLAGRAARLVLTGVCFGVVSVAGRAGSRMSWGPLTPGMTGWRPRELAPRDVGSSIQPLTGAGWVRTYLAWTRSTDNAWAAALLPYLWLFRVLRREERGSLDEAIYTLF